MASVNFTPPYGPPGPGSGWEDAMAGGTPITGAALDTMTQGIIDAVAALNEVLTGPIGSLVLNYSKLPIGTAAGTVAAGDDSRIVAIDPNLAFALLVVQESSPGSGIYTRPNSTMRFAFLGTVPATTGGTTAGGTGNSVAVAGKDIILQAL